MTSQSSALLGDVPPFLSDESELPRGKTRGSQFSGLLTGYLSGKQGEMLCLHCASFNLLNRASSSMLLPYLPDSAFYRSMFSD